MATVQASPAKRPGKPDQTREKPTRDGCQTTGDDGRRTGDGRETDGRRTGDGHLSRSCWTLKFEESTSHAKLKFRNFFKKKIYFFLLTLPREGPPSPVRLPSSPVRLPSVSRRLPWWPWMGELRADIDYVCVCLVAMDRPSHVRRLKISILPRFFLTSIGDQFSGM